jgi:hypothetical protein
MNIKDPTVYAIHFVANPPPRHGAHDAARAPKAGDRPLTVVEFVNQAAAKFAEALNAGEPKPIGQIDCVENAIDLVTEVGPGKVPGPDKPGDRELYLDVRTLHDAVMVRTVVLYERTLAVSDLPQLDFEPPLPVARVAGYLGSLRILYFETDRKGRQQADVARAAAVALDQSWLAQAEPLLTPLGMLLVAVKPRPAHQTREAPALDMVLVGGAGTLQATREYRLHPVHVTLPELALCHLKVRNAAANLRGHWLKNLADRERDLHGLFPEDRPWDLFRMLAHNREIMTRQAGLVQAGAEVEAELRTMRINRDNFVAAAKARPFRRVADKLRHLLIDNFMRPVEVQAENDLGYVEGTLKLAEGHFKSIDASAEVKQSSYLWWINFWVLLLGSVQVLIGLTAVYLAWKGLPASPAATPEKKMEAPALPSPGIEAAPRSQSGATGHKVGRISLGAS